MIALLFTLGPARLWGVVSGKDQAAAAKASEELFDQARATAVGKATSAIIIPADPQDHR